MLYALFASLIYACIAAILILAAGFGTRARRNVKKERVTSLPEGFSPLDVQRIFIGKTNVRRLTRALIVHWAQMGYIMVEQLEKRNSVRLIKLKYPPLHDSADAVFFDRGTYVRECELFKFLFTKRDNVTVKLNAPLFSKLDVNCVDNDFAVREDEGVYTALHYKLKMLTTALSVLPIYLAGLYMCISEGEIMGIILCAVMTVGLFVLRFMTEIPVLFRLVWCTGWLFAPVAIIALDFKNLYDPAYIAIAAAVILFAGTFFLVRFVDYRDKPNLDDYSDLRNFRKFLITAKKEELASCDYYSALPLIYALNIGFLVKKKFVKGEPPAWYFNETGKEGKLL